MKLQDSFNNISLCSNQHWLITLITLVIRTFLLDMIVDDEQIHVIIISVFVWLEFFLFLAVPAHFNPSFIQKTQDFYSVVIWAFAWQHYKSTEENP